jgi:hypothetical protein
MGRISGVLGIGSVIAFVVGLANLGERIQFGGEQGLIILPAWVVVLLAPIVLAFAVFLAGVASRREAIQVDAQRQARMRQSDAARRQALSASTDQAAFRATPMGAMPGGPRETPSVSTEGVDCVWCHLTLGREGGHAEDCIIRVRPGVGH